MEEHADLLEQRIINTTIKQIRKEGYAAISLRKIASQIDVTTGAFYKRFDSKATLFAAATASLSHSLAQQVQELVAPISDPTEKLLRTAKLLLDKFQRDPHIMDFLFFNPTAQKFSDETPPDSRFPFYDYVMEIIADLQQTHRNLDPHKLFIQIWSFIQGYGLLIAKHATSYDPALVETTLNSFLKA